MVINATSLTGNGLRDWIIQRYTAVYLAIYTLFLLLFIISHPHMDYLVWRQLFSHNVMRIASLIAFISIALHAWIGMWTVFTDYVKCYCLRLTLYLLMLVALLGWFVWGIQILWSI